VSALFGKAGQMDQYNLVIRDMPPNWFAIGQMCRRCSAVVIDTAQHEKWHGSVDTNQTAKVE
jgi:hypothetical protein